MPNDTELSKLLSYWLRHKPEDGNLSIDSAGWVEVDGVLAALMRKGRAAVREDIERVVSQSDKGRFETSLDGRHIRARQGHSISVNLEWPIAEPPDFLFHGTIERFLEPILSEGLKPMARHHVHLSADKETAVVVGARRGKPVLLQIAAARMFANGQVFRLSGNGVWLTDHVPASQITKL